MLEEGDVIELEDGMKVNAYVPEHFIYTNKRGSFEITHGSITLGGHFDYLCGKYVVYKTTSDCGSLSPYHAHNDGHHVYCEKIDDNDIKVDFYQSGSYWAMIEEIEPIGKATRVWEWGG